MRKYRSILCCPYHFLTTSQLFNPNSSLTMLVPSPPKSYILVTPNASTYATLVLLKRSIMRSLMLLPVLMLYIFFATLLPCVFALSFSHSHLYCIFSASLPHFRCNGTTIATRRTYGSISRHSAVSAEPPVSQ